MKKWSGALAERPDAPKILVLQGPTASGKSRAAVNIALACNGEIVNADSLQLYREFDIGTAKPSLAERSIVPHHLFDVLEPTEISDAGSYIRMAAETIRNIAERGRLPIVCGGTNLYIRALVGGIADMPPRDNNLRREYEALLISGGAAELFARLEKIAPEAAEHIDRLNPVRIIRALEVQEQSGRPIWEWQREHAFAERPYNALRFGLSVDPDELRLRMRHRVEEMLSAGLIEECSAIRARYKDLYVPPLGSIGYSEVCTFLDGELEREALVDKIEISTWRYAKRQITWMKREKGLEFFCWPRDETRMIERVKSFLAAVD